MKICIFGSADFGKPRTRILINGLREQNVVVAECLFDIWSGVEDKSQVKGLGLRFRLILHYLVAYPILIWRYLRAPRHDIVFVGYMGNFDVLVLWPFAKLRGARIVWDAFLSLYDTIVEDRKLITAGSLSAWIIKRFERFVCAAADIVILDTQAHAEYFKNSYGVPDKKLMSVYVGTETNIFRHQKLCKAKVTDGKFRVLFYGQFIPLHGIEFIIDAARRTTDPSIEWVIVGRGQETKKIQELAERNNISSLTFIDWIDYDKLPAAIANADVCLGVFGESEKAARVIPNKVFQIIAVGRPLITLKSATICRLLPTGTPGLWLVPPGSGAAIAQAVVDAKNWLRETDQDTLYEGVRTGITPKAIAQDLTQSLHDRF
jgi:glycosyltransferase involved in cell wall biosynthesis